MSAEAFKVHRACVLVNPYQKVIGVHMTFHSTLVVAMQLVRLVLAGYVLPTLQHFDNLVEGCKEFRLMHVTLIVLAELRAIDNLPHPSMDLVIASTLLVFTTPAYLPERASSIAPRVFLLGL